MIRFRTIAFGIIALLATASTTFSARADEGMWLLPFIQKLNIEQMKQRGFRLTAEDIYSLNQRALKDAIVIFGGGCTGEVISPQGLVLTNHHCGYSTIQSHSSLENDYLRDGFWAASLKDEIASPGLGVVFVKEIVDVTDRIESLMPKGPMTESERSKALSKAYDNVAKAYKDPKKSINAQVSSMYGGNQFLLFVTQRYGDVRMVGAPPSSIGKFGGETDNWMWPRHTGDFSLFRIYTAPDGSPAEYAPENVPFVAPKHLEVSLRGYKEGDYSMIIGFPGRTTRYMTTYEIDRMLDQENPIRIFVRGERQKLLWEDMIASDEVRIKYANKYAGSSNYWKNSIGKSRGLRKLNIRDKKDAQQQAFTEWINADSARKAIYGDALPMIARSVAASRPAARVRQLMSEALSTGVESYSLAGGAQAILADEKNDKKAIERLRKLGESFFKNYHAPTDRKVTPRMLQIFADSVQVADQPDFFTAVRGNIESYSADLFDRSIFTSPKRFTAAISADKLDRTAIESDPAVVAALSIRNKSRELGKQIDPQNELFAHGHRLWVKGLLEMNPDQSMAPDANSTMRMTYGQVLPYWAADAVFYNYFTTLSGVMAKENPASPEFVVPARLKELYKAKDFGRYAIDGDVPVAMLSNNDITGGNSGSGVLDADGRLIGLAFDGNWEAMSGDIAFEPDLQRTISVDIRYVLFIIDKFAGAQRLIDEMTIVE